MAYLTADEAVDEVKLSMWSDVSVDQRLALLMQVRRNLVQHALELSELDTQMKNAYVEGPAYQAEFSLLQTVTPMGSWLTACIELYRQLQMDRFSSFAKVITQHSDFSEVCVFPNTVKDRLLYYDRKDYLRIKEPIQQTNPMDKKGRVIVCLGAGYYSSPIEVIQALFLENCVVVYKSHPINEVTDLIWHAILQPLVDCHALRFCFPDQTETLLVDSRVDEIHMVGNQTAVQEVENKSTLPVVPLRGGNNPCLIVPGIQPWSLKELKQCALELATMVKLNGGANCARSQTLITCRRWPQREVFLALLKQALKDVLARNSASYYPKSKTRQNSYLLEHLERETILSYTDQFKSGEVIFATNVDELDAIHSEESFRNVLVEMPLNCLPDAKDFLTMATHFCNHNLYGSLNCTIFIDDQTKGENQVHFQQALHELHYGTITINTLPLLAFLNPYVHWGSYCVDRKLTVGFGNLMCFDQVEKSIIDDRFLSFRRLNSNAHDCMSQLSLRLSDYVLEPTWKNVMRLASICLYNHSR